MISKKDYKKIGITSYFTKSKGIKGIVKEKPEDFVVQEISEDGKIADLEPSTSYKLPVTSLPYTHFTLVKKHWDEARLLKKISQQLGVSRKRFSFAGTKDKDALTSQRVSAWKIFPEQLSKVTLSDCKIGDFEQNNKQIEFGKLLGNRFTITLRNVNKKAEPQLKKFLEEIKKYRGIPNFFGEQRFGIRLNNHMIGKKLLQNNAKEAMKIFLTETSASDSPEVKKARKFLEKNWGNFSGALKIFPRRMYFELMVLNHLVKYPNDYVNAFKKLPKMTYKMFVHAYQSYLFNKILSEKLKNNKKSKEGNLIGYNSKLTKNEKELLKKEKLVQKNFRIRIFPEASVSGGRRKFISEVRDLSYEFLENNLILKFSLEKGAYATILLRELIKPK